MHNILPFSRLEAVQLWSRLVAGWAHSLDAEGARTLLDGMPNGADVGGSYEGVTRMLWGIGGWLSQPGRSPLVEWRGETFDLEALMRRALVNGCDPDSPSYWGAGYRPDGGNDQRTVECGQVAFALWQTRARIWNQLDTDARGLIVDFLDRFGQRPPEWFSNWALFWALNHACRKALGAPFDPDIIDEVINGYLDDVYCGDGWYDDAARRGAGQFDDYNTWVFASHVLAWTQVDGHMQPDRRDELLDRVRQWMSHYPYFFAANGTYCEFGRSLAYKFARLGAPLWAYKMGVWPHSIGMLKRLVGRHLRWYVDRGAIRADGTLRQPLTAGGSIEICEPYISTGATYWAMQAFGGLWNLPDDDRFWRIEEEPLPAEQGDFVRIFPQPGWIVTANRGEVQRFNGGSLEPIGPKYARFVYSTLHPFNVGLSGGCPAPDNMLSLTDGKTRGQRTKNLACAVGEPGWLRIRWEQTLNRCTHIIDTVIIVRGEQHVRAHRVTLDPAETRQLAALEGCAPLGTIQGEAPVLLSGTGWQSASTGTKGTAIVNISGYDESDIWHGDPGINSVFPFDVVPVLTVEAVQSQHELVCLVHNGGAVDVETLLSARVTAEWRRDGSFRLDWDGQITVIPPIVSDKIPARLTP